MPKKINIGKNYKPFIIAEISGNHNGSLKNALSIVRSAARCGVSAIKLQTYTADTMTLNTNKKEFLIKDNVSGGEWDFEMLANEWDVEQLEDWGLDIPIFMEEPSYQDLIGEEKNKPATMKITFESAEQLQKAEIEIQELLDRNYSGAYFSVSAGQI